MRIAEYVISIPNSFISVMATEQPPYISSSIGAMLNLSPQKHRPKSIFNSSHAQLFPDLQDSLTKLDGAISDSVREDMPNFSPADMPITGQVFTPVRHTDTLTDSFAALTEGELHDRSK